MVNTGKQELAVKAVRESLKAVAKLARIREDLLQKPTPTKELVALRDRLLSLNEDLTVALKKTLAMRSTRFLDGVQTDVPSGAKTRYKAPHQSRGGAPTFFHPPVPPCGSAHHVFGSSTKKSARLTANKLVMNVGTLN